jgi:putative ABC transport system permease protein
MIAVALKGLLGRKTRAILTALAIVLGTGMVSATFIFTDTLNKAFNGVFSSSYKQTSVVVTGKQIVTGAATTPTLPASLLPRIEAVPGVEAASGAFLFETVKLVGTDGETIDANGAPQFGFGIDAGDKRFNPLALTAGSWPSGPQQIAIGAATAKDEHYDVGDTIRAKGNTGPIQRYTLTGLVELPGVSLGSATIAMFDVATAQALLGKQGRYGSISVIGTPDATPELLATRIKPLLAATQTVRSSAAQASSDNKTVTGGTGGLRYILLAFAAIALFVGAFVIFNTISMTVAQRTRELATLRTLGASRRQVLRSVLLESAVIGAAASVLGLGLGLLLFKALSILFKGLPEAGTVISPRTVVITMAVGTGVTLLAGLFPALRATRVAPISAVREGAVAPVGRFARYKPYLAGALIVLAVLAIAVGVFSSGGASGVLVPAAAGTLLLLFIGVAMISSRLIPPLIWLVGAPARRLGGSAGRLASANAGRNPSRTAATAAALMIGLALVTFVAVLASGLESSATEDLDRQVKSDYVVAPDRGASSEYFDAAAGRALTSVPGVSRVSAVHSDKARVLGSTVSVHGIDARTIGSVYRFAWKDGSDAVLTKLGDGAIVDSKWATEHKLSIGSRLAIETAEGRTRTLVVRATYHPKFQPVFSGILIDQAAFDRAFPKPQSSYVFVNASSGATPAVTTALKRSLARFSDVTVETKSGWIATENKSISSTLDIFYAFLALSVIVSLFGMVNTLVLSVFERTREIGMLRAIGVSRRQLRRMIRQESVITALIGAALGLPLGVFLAAILTRATASQGISFHLPVAQLAIFTLIAVIAGITAAVLPARRASRLNVLEALQYE